MRPIGTIASTIATGLTLVLGAAAAQAQTAVTRQITSEPVETVITRGPNGAAVTRRILSPEPGVRTYAAPPLVYPPAAVEAVEAQYYDYAEPAAPALPARRVTTTTKSTSRTVGLAPARTATTRETTTRPARTATRTVTTVAAPPVAYDQPLVLSPAQRQVIYRTVVQREYYPAPDVYAPPPVTGYPQRTVYPADYAYRDYAYDPYYNTTYNSGYRPDPYYDRDYRDPYHTAYRWDGVPLVVGARIPQSVPLYAVPEPVAFRIPAARPYSYAVLDNRVFLVDPATGVIVAEISP